MLKKRIPTIIGLLLLLLGAVGGVAFINQGTSFLPRAAPEYSPQKVRLTNLTDTGVVISWVTEQPTIGFIRYSDNPVNLSLTATDDRDQLSGSSSDYRTHYVSLNNLKPSTSYYFKIGSYQSQLYDNNGQPFSLTLPKSVADLPPTDTAYGSVATAVDTPAEGAIVYLSISGGTPLSALVQQNGNWAINLSMSLTPDYQKYLSYDPTSTQLDILVQPDAGAATTAKTTTNNDQPVPKIILGKTNLFADQPEPTQTPIPTPDPSLAPAPTPMIDETAPVSSSSGTSTNKFPLGPFAVTNFSSDSISESSDQNTDPTLQQVDLAYAATPAATPVATPKPTPIPTLVPTPKPTPRANSATSSATPQSGSITPGLTLATLGVLILLVGSYFQLGNKNRH